MARPAYQTRLAETLACREQCAPIFLPLFDNMLVLAADSQKHGHAQAAGRELAHARKVATYPVCKRCGQPITGGSTGGTRCSAGCEPRSTCTVGFETLTDESIENGDIEDCGHVHPKTEKRHSYRKGGERVRQANIRRSRAGEFDWRLRDAIEWLDSNNPGYLEGYLDSGRVLTSGESTDGKVRLVWTLTVRAIADGYDIVVGRNGYQHAETRENLELHFRTESHGSRERLKRVLAARFNVRFYTMG
jgi:hypothetical protein